VADPAVWPDTLPQTPYRPDNSTPEYTPTDNTIRTSVTVGPAKLRRRFTAVPETVKIQLWLTSDQLATLRNFVEVTLEDVLPFTWVDFRDDSQCTYRFPKGRASIPHKYDSGSDIEGQEIWILDIELERLP
jgi:hypothetical protein